MLRRQLITQAEEEPRDSFFIQNPFERQNRRQRVKSVAEEYDDYLKLLQRIARFENERVKGVLVGRDVSHLRYSRNEAIQEAIQSTNNLRFKELISDPFANKVNKGLRSLINNTFGVGVDFNERNIVLSSREPDVVAEVMMPRKGRLQNAYLKLIGEYVGLDRNDIDGIRERVNREDDGSPEAQNAKQSVQNLLNEFDSDFNEMDSNRKARADEEKFEKETFGGALPTTEQGAEFTANGADDLLETTLVPAPPTPEQEPITPLTGAVPGERTPEGAMTPLTQIVPGERTPTRAMTPLTQALPAPATPVRSPFERTTSFSQGELLQAGLAQFGFGNITSIQMDDFTLPPPTVGYDEHYHKQHSLVRNEERDQEDGTRIFLRPAFRVPLRAQPASARTEQNQAPVPVPVPEPEEPPKPDDPDAPNPDPGFPF